MSRPTRVVVVPGALALLPRYAGRVDPFPELRDACLEAVAWLAEPPVVLGDPQGLRVGAALAAAVGLDASVRPSRTLTTPPGDGCSGRDDHAAASAGEDGETSAYLVVANGSARRTDASPGPYDERALAFDESLGKALKDADAAALAAVDQDLARQLWAATAALPALAELLAGTRSVSVDYEDAPFGVAYWVVRYENAGR